MQRAQTTPTAREFYGKVSLKGANFYIPHSGFDSTDPHVLHRVSQELGFSDQYKCYGYVATVLPAILLGQYREINQQIEWIYDFYEVEYNYGFKISDTLESIRNGEATVPQDQLNIVLSIPDFFKNIDYHQSPENYPEMFPAHCVPAQYDLFATLPYTMPEALASQLPKADGQPQLARSSISMSAFRFKELLHFFSLIQTAADKVNCNATLILSSFSHAKLVAYSVSDKTWISVDILIPHIEPLRVDELSSRVLDGFTDKEQALFSWQFVGIKQNHIDAMLGILSATSRWNGLLKLKRRQLSVSGYHDENLAHVAAQIGDIKTLDFIKTKNPRLFVETGCHFGSPLKAAVESGQIETIKYFLNHYDIAEKKELFFEVIRQNQARLLHFLLENGFSPNERDVNSNEALVIASLLGSLECAKELLKAGATITNDLAKRMHFENTVLKKYFLRFQRLQRNVDSISDTNIPARNTALQHVRTSGVSCDDAFYFSVLACFMSAEQTYQKYKANPSHHLLQELNDQYQQVLDVKPGTATISTPELSFFRAPSKRSAEGRAGSVKKSRLKK